MFDSLEQLCPSETTKLKPHENELNELKRHNSF